MTHQSVADARAEYAAVARAMAAAAITHRAGLHPAEAWRCESCHWLGRVIESASLTLDLAVALQVAGHMPRFAPPTWWVLPEDVAW